MDTYQILSLLFSTLIAFSGIKNFYLADDDLFR